MRTLFLFLWKYNFFLLFLLMESLCMYIIVRNNSFQHASVLNSANRVAAGVQGVVNSVSGYINLKAENEALARENAALRVYIPDVVALDSARHRLRTDTMFHQQYDFLTARVINNSVNRRNNYLTLDKGSRHGVHKDMGVICPNGIVGIVKDVSENFCTVMSFLHKESHVSARLKKSGDFGSLVWDGYDASTASLLEIARHVKVQKGDTLVTTRFSKHYPDGTLVGTVDEVDRNTPGNFYTIRVKLSTPFGSLAHVYIISNLLKEEQETLEATEKHDP
jgi:rod shape-determining protein MreC